MEHTHTHTPEKANALKSREDCARFLKNFFFFFFFENNVQQTDRPHTGYRSNYPTTASHIQRLDRFPEREKLSRGYNVDSFSFSALR